MFNPKIKIITKKEPNTIHILQMKDSIVIEVKNGKNEIKLDKVSNYYNSKKEDSDYFVDLLFSYKNELFYTVTDESFWCPTCERMIKKYYTSTSNSEIKRILNSYRDVMSDEKSSFEEIIQANHPILSLLPSGKYTLSLRNVFPTFGESEIFSDFFDKILTSSADLYYRYSENMKEYISVEALTAYMLPTQPKEIYSEETLNNYRKSSYLGRGLVLNLSGFLGCLLDGHHKAKIAYERKQPLECLVIEPHVEDIIYQKMKTAGESLRFSQIPTLEEFCYMQSFLSENEISAIDDLVKIVEALKKDKGVIFYEEMENLIVTLKMFAPNLLVDLYKLILENYWYKSIRLKYFSCLTKLKRTEEIEQLVLDFLINDEYEDRALTKLCEDYFR